MGQVASQVALEGNWVFCQIIRPQFMDNSIKHTPLPWRIERNELDNRFEIRSTSGRFGRFVGWFADGIKTEQEDKSNAAFIVQAVNSHYALVEALRGLLYANAVEGGPKQALSNARKALAAATSPQH
jgi:hypothetical protein